MFEKQAREKAQVTARCRPVPHPPGGYSGFPSAARGSVCQADGFMMTVPVRAAGPAAERVHRRVSQGGIDADTARQNAQGVRQAISAFRAGQPVDTAALLPSVVQALTPVTLSPANARYLRTHDAVDMRDLRRQAAHRPRAG
jgi:hypothetical protein